MPALSRTLRVIVDLWTLIDRRNVALVAAGVAFYGMLAVFPALTAVVSIWSWMADPAVLRSYTSVAAGFIPPEAFSLLNAQVEALITSSTGGVAWRAVLSLMVALWSARAGLASVVRGLNAIHGYPSRKGPRQLMVAMLLTLAIIGMAIVALATVVVLPIVLSFLPLGPVEGWLVGGLPWAVTFLLVIATISLIYRYGPNTKRSVRAGWITPGAGIAAALWAAASLGFSVYLTNFGNYNRVYGSLGAGIALLMWLYLSSYAVLLGAAINQILGIPKPDRIEP